MGWCPPPHPPAFARRKSTAEEIWTVPDHEVVGKDAPPQQRIVQDEEAGEEQQHHNQVLQQANSSVTGDLAIQSFCTWEFVGTSLQICCIIPIYAVLILCQCYSLDSKSDLFTPLFSYQ